jgi:hypothetical protein
MRSRLSVRTCLVLAALAMAGCGSTGRPLAGVDPFAAGGATPAEIRIRIRNSNFYDATVTVVGDMGTRRLGTVGGNQSATFTTPWSFTGGLRLQIDLLAGPTCNTDMITVSPGDDLNIEIPPDLNTGSLCR